MEALVYHGPGQKDWETKPDPSVVAATDAIVRIDSSTICGTDLHILKGDVPEVQPGTILGHTSGSEGCRRRRRHPSSSGHPDGSSAEAPLTAGAGAVCGWSRRCERPRWPWASVP